MWIRKGNQINLSVRVSPNAKRTKTDGIWNGTHLKIALAAPPVDGKANEALVDFMTEFFAVRKSAVAVVVGQTSRQKTVAIVFPTEKEACLAEDKLRQI